MCTVCGCGNGEGDDTRMQNKHSHVHEHVHPTRLSSLTIKSQIRLLDIEQDILSKNNRFAEENRHFFSKSEILALNLVSSPGSGKTTLLAHTVEVLKKEFPICVVEGDQQTSKDADRIRATGVAVKQINTGKGCHLDAHMVGHAIKELNPPARGIVFIENVGNLVCPAAFDLGEAHKIVILSVTEGEDKPIKYPDMFAAADLMVINKIDLLPYLEFNLEECIQYAFKVNPHIRVIEVSATTGEGMDSLCQWLRQAKSTTRNCVQSEKSSV